MQKVGILLYLLVTLSFSTPKECIRIVHHLTPQAPAFIFSLKAFAQYQRDIEGKSQYTAPTHAGIRIDIPLYDPREKWQMKKEHIRALDFARRLLAQYLALKYEVEEMKKYLTWQWKRVQAGIEYRKDVWKEEITLKQKQGELKALTALLMSAGIKEKDLRKCYESASK